MKIYEYAILYTPTSDEAKKGDKAKLVVSPTVLLAKDDTEAQFKAARAVPIDYENCYAQLTVAVRPF